jgi:hypothetical protein
MCVGLQLASNFHEAKNKISNHVDSLAALSWKKTNEVRFIFQQ